MTKPNKKNTLYFFILIFALTVSNTFPQSHKSEIDSINNMPYDGIVSQPRLNLKLFEKNLKAAEASGYKYGEAKALLNLGMVYYLLGDYDMNTEYNLKAIKVLEELNLFNELADSYAQFGFQLKRRDMTKAKKYMRMAINLAEKYNLIISLTTIYDNYGIVLEMDNSVDSAIYYYNKSLQLNRALNNLVGIPFNLNHLAGANTIKGNFKKAIAYLKESDKYRAKEEGDYGRAENLVFYGDLYYAMGNYVLAKKKYLECLKLAKKISNNYMISYGYEYLAKISEKTGNYKKALENSKLYCAYKDSLVNVETNKKIAELEIDYESEKKDRKIAENKQQIRRRNMQLIAAAGLIIFLILFSYLVYRIQKLKRDRIQRELELKSKLKQAELERKISDEKLRVSRDLHDNIGSNLTFLVSSIDNLSYIEKGRNKKEKLENLSNFGRGTLSELRNTIWAMNSEGGDVNKLILKITELKQNLNEQLNGINIDVINKIEKTFTLSSSRMLNLYRIVQEAVQNVIKYADATFVKIKFSNSSEHFTLKIIDDGKGFDLNNIKNGNGLKNMQYRCKQSNGEFSIESSENGTTIKCIFSFK